MHSSIIAHVTVHTSKLAESLAFYQWLLDLSVANELITPGGKILFLGQGETKFELVEDKDAKPVQDKNINIGFTVEDLNNKLAMLDAKNITHTDIIAPDPGVRFAFFTDLNGCVIQLFERKA